MTDSTNSSRRQFMAGALMAAAGLTVAPHTIWAATPASAAFDHKAMLDCLCDIVIPATDTPGAKGVNASAFVMKAAEHALKGAQISDVDTFAVALNDYAGADFLSVKAEQQFSLIEKLDAQVYDRAASASLPPALMLWQKIKSLILVAYYTSEVGASKELKYLLIPGQFKPDVPLSEEPRAWSNDWTGVKYG